MNGFSVLGDVNHHLDQDHREGMRGALSPKAESQKSIRAVSTRP